MHRRTLLSLAAAPLLDAAPRPIPIIDTHIHLFDPTRPEGVPWPSRNNAVLYRPALPPRYRALAEPFGVVGAIEVECSPWLEDNQWVLDIAERDPIIVGTVGNLEPGKPEFRRHLDRFHRSPLFRGIRNGNLWGRNFAASLAQPQFIADLKALADAGLSLDVANPNPDLIANVVRLTDRVPELRVIIDHLPQLWPLEPVLADLRKLGQRRQIYVKVSEVLRRVDGRVPAELEFYRPTLDTLWDIFGVDRLIYGSDWPNSDQWGSYAQVLGVVRKYFVAKGPEAIEKYFWKNSVAAYRWKPRNAAQPRLAG